MRIAYVIPKFPGQTHIFFWRERNALRELGFEVEIVSTRRPPRSEVCHAWAADAMRSTRYLLPPGIGGLLEGLVEVMRAGPLAWARCVGACVRADGGLKGKVKIAAMLPVGGMLAGMARKRGWSHIHAHSCGNAASIAMFASMLSGVSYGLTLHGPIEHYGPGQNVKWENAKFGVAVTERLKAEVRAAAPRVCESKIAVAPMGVDLDRFVRRSPYVASREGEQARIVTCGRLHRGKGHQDLIRAVGLLRSRGVDARLMLLGEGPARAELEEVVKELGLQQSVTLRGAVSEEDVCSELERSHVFALGSHDEALGVATMEAMAMGLPVVVTRVGGVPELVRDGVDGVLVEAKNPESVAAGLARVLRDPAFAAEAGDSGRIRVHERFGSRVSARVIAERLGVNGGARA